MTRRELSVVQKDALFQAVAELAHAAATDRAAKLPDPTLAGAADLSVGGVFVSLKKGKHLRGCVGGLRPQPVPLASVLADAVEGCVLRDVRFPVVSLGELAHLDVEIWLLDEPRPMTARGEDRVAAVTTGGKHGLIVARGEQRGLLLPGVALEHDWDSRTFLEQTCVKAGIHPASWKDDLTAISTFEGEAIRAPLSRWLAPEVAPPFTDRTELESYFDFLWGNIVNLFEGCTPRFFDPSVREITVNGIVLRLRPPNSAKLIFLTHLSMRPGIAAQNTLFQLAQAGAQQLAQLGVRLPTLSQVGMGLTLLGDPHIHGSVASPDLRGFDPATRAIIVSERNRQGFAFGPERTAESLVAEAAELAQVNQREAANILSLRVFSTDKTASFSTAPQPRRGPAERLPGVAGTFYPGEPGPLFNLIDELLSKSKPTVPPRAVAAAMVPHAGLRFSGAIAAQVLQSIVLPRTILILGPKHTAQGMEWAVAPHQTWQLPGAELASDFILARRLSQAIPGLAMDAEAHLREHAIEVELPFLARLAPQSRITGMVFGHGDWPAAERIAAGLAHVIAAMPEPPLLLISSDMNHFATDAENRRLDAQALAALDRLDPRSAFEEITRNHISMCGVFPAVVVMETLRLLGRLKRATRCGYATSADVGGDPGRVVGYAGMLFE